jgi:hypothetical protein
MKKDAFIVFLLVNLMIPGYSLTAQQLFLKGDKEVSTGIGFGSSYINKGYSTQSPPLSITFDFALRDDWGPGVFGVGGYIGSAFYKYRSINPVTSNMFGYNYSALTLGARASYHYVFTENLDTYVGLVLGVRFSSDNPSGDHEHADSKPDQALSNVNTLLVGAKYFFSSNFSTFTEISLGYGIPYFTLGVGCKF